MSGGQLHWQVNTFSRPAFAQMQERIGSLRWGREGPAVTASTHLGHRGTCSWCPRCGRCRERRGWARRSPPAGHRRGPWSQRCSCSQSAPRRRSRSRCSGTAMRRTGLPSLRRRSRSTLPGHAEPEDGLDIFKLYLHVTTCKLSATFFSSLWID